MKTFINNKFDIDEMVMSNNRGDTNLITVLIAIGLGVFLLVVLAIGLSGGWDNFKDKLGWYAPAQNTVASVGQACNVACDQRNDNSYCKTLQTVKGLTLTDVVKFGTIEDGKFNASEAYNNTIGTSQKDGWQLKGLNCAQLQGEGIIIVNNCGSTCPLPA